jgi:predicted phosphate transport protein (TIGR00153 family)
MANSVANIFGKSPVQPLEQHCDMVYRCAAKLRPFFKAVIEGDEQRAREVRSQIEVLEQEADALKKAIRQQMPRSLFMPVPRQDLIELLLVQDKIANRTRDVSGIVIGRHLQIPDAVVDQFLRFVDLNIDAAKQARKSVRELDELYTVGFKGAEVELVSTMIEKLDAIESRTDSAAVALRAGVYEIEDTLNPVDAVFLYEIITLTGEIADMAERVGRRLELLLS